MLRYVAVAVAALLLLALALRSRAGNGAAPALSVPPDVAPAIHVEAAPKGGRIVTVRHTFRGSVTRAAIVYEEAGEDRHAAVQTDCRRGGDASVEDDGYATAVELVGVVPDGAKRVRLVLESETGTRSYPIEP
jgi:hypothetical protein